MGLRSTRPIILASGLGLLVLASTSARAASSASFDVDSWVDFTVNLAKCGGDFTYQFNYGTTKFSESQHGTGFENGSSSETKLQPDFILDNHVNGGATSPGGDAHIDALDGLAKIVFKTDSCNSVKVTVDVAFKSKIHLGNTDPSKNTVFGQTFAKVSSKDTGSSYTYSKQYSTVGNRDNSQTKEFNFYVKKGCDVTWSIENDTHGKANVRQDCVPEPTSMAALAIGAIALVRRRIKK